MSFCYTSFEYHAWLSTIILEEEGDGGGGIIALIFRIYASIQPQTLLLAEFTSDARGADTVRVEATRSQVFVNPTSEVSRRPSVTCSCGQI